MTSEEMVKQDQMKVNEKINKVAGSGAYESKVDMPEEFTPEVEAELKVLEELLQNDGMFSDLQEKSILIYSEMVLRKNRYLNLTSITDAEGFYSKHIIDSLALLEFVDEIISENNQTKIAFLDVGSGAGFPGIPIKIMRPEIETVLLDSLNKRVKFLESVAQELKLDDINFLHGRAEDFAHLPEYREGFDIVTARAVAKLPTLLELTLPYVKKSAVFLAMKTSEEELKTAKKALNILGARVESEKNLILPFEAGERTIIKIRKDKSTPKKYPRQAGTPSKDPLI